MISLKKFFVFKNAIKIYFLTFLITNIFLLYSIYNSYLSIHIHTKVILNPILGYDLAEYLYFQTQSNKSNLIKDIKLQNKKLFNETKIKLTPSIIKGSYNFNIDTFIRKKTGNILKTQNDHKKIKSLVTKYYEEIFKQEQVQKIENYFLTVKQYSIEKNTTVKNNFTRNTNFKKFIPTIESKPYISTFPIVKSLAIYNLFGIFICIAFALIRRDFKF